MRFFTSDLHLGHSNVLSHDGRPFSSIQEHDQNIVVQWNSVVAPEDVVWILGDVAFRCSFTYFHNLVSQLNGELHLIQGNHDHSVALSKPSNLFKSVSHMDILTIKGWTPKELTELGITQKVNGRRLTLCHYPMESWYGSRTETGFLIHGHTHKPTIRKGSINVGIHLWDYRPVSEGQVLKNVLG